MSELPEAQGDVTPKGESYGKPAINLIFEQWEQVMGYPITVRKMENRRFAQHLLRRESGQRIAEYIMIASVARTDKYAPRITSIVDLYYKWDKLTDWAMRRGAQRNDVINLE